MIPHEEFSRLRKEMAADDERREMAIRESREAVRLTKQVIYALQRMDVSGAEELLPKMKSLMRKLSRQKENDVAPQVRIAGQEFAEAMCFYEFVKRGKLPTAAQLGIKSEHYLLGICDLAGELGRFGVNAAIRKEDEKARQARRFLDDIYGELLQFDFRNGELRKKFDSVKYELKKLEDLELGLSRR